MPRNVTASTPSAASTASQAETEAEAEAETEAAAEALRAGASKPAAGRAVVPALLLAGLAVSMAQTIVISALPAFGRQFSVSATGAAWVLTAFMLASAIATPIAGRLGDMLGYRTVLLACLGVFTAGTLIAALGTEGGSMAVVLIGRTLQGIGGGVFPLAFGIARSCLPPDRLRSVVALLSAMFGIGGAAGMVLAGPLVDAAGTPALFWVTLALAVLALALSGLLPAAGSRRPGRLDLRGAALLSGVLVGLLLAISQGSTWGWASARVIGLFVFTALLAVVFVAVQARVADPLVDLRLLRQRAVATANLATLVLGTAMFGVITLIPRFVQTPPAAGYGFGVSVTGAGLVLIPVAVVMLTAGAVTTRLGNRYGARLPLWLGAVCAAVAFALLAAIHHQLWQFYLIGLPIGAGYGLAFAALGTLVVDAVRPRETGIATAVNTIVRTVGGALGAQIAAAILTSSTSTATVRPTETSYTVAFVTFAVIAVAALGSTFTIPATASRPPTAARSPTSSLTSSEPTTLRGQAF